MSVTHFNPTKGYPPLIVKVMDPDRDEYQCHWFLGCTEVADKDVEHPTLGWISCCDIHIAWLREEE